MKDRLPVLFPKSYERLEKLKGEIKELENTASTLTCTKTLIETNVLIKRKVALFNKLEKMFLGETSKIIKREVYNETA